MLRSKGLTEKVVLLGIDGMDPTFSRRMVDEGKMPNLKKLIEKGSARKDLRLLGANPTITPPMWTTLSTGAYPMTHGVEDFNINLKGELDVNFAGIYSKYVHAEPLWNITAEAGKKTLVWHWPGGAWPPTSDSENLMVVDGSTPGALGFGYAMRDNEVTVIANLKAEKPSYHMYCAPHSKGYDGDGSDLHFSGTGTRDTSKKPYHDELWAEFSEGIACNGYKPKRYMDYRLMHSLPGDSGMDTLKRFPQNIALSPLTEPTGWANELPEGAKEFTWLQIFGNLPAPCLLLKNEQGVYDRVAVYMSKEMPQPVALLVKGEYVANVPGICPKGQTGEMEKIIRNMCLLDCAEDGTYLRMWASQGFSAEDNCVWYPHWVFDKVVGKFGPPVPTGQGFGGDFDIMDCNFKQWEQAAKWQANGMKYMMQEEGADVVFSHFHGPDMMGHCYMTWLKDRKVAYDERSISVAPEEEIHKLHERTYQITDDYIGEFLPMIDEGWTILLFSDHSLVCRNEDMIHQIGDNMGVNTGVMLELGYTALLKDENGNLIPEIDWENTKAVQQRSNSIFINLKGRDRFGIVDPADKYELEEQIITDLYGYKHPKTGKRIVALALHKKDANLLGLGGEYTGADIIFFVHDDYAVDHGEGLSTATGYDDTTLSPIFVAAGPGIKEGFQMELFPREVDIAPTAAVLLGVRIPAQCEGCPSYSILSEEL